MYIYIYISRHVISWLDTKVYILYLIHYSDFSAAKAM